MTNVHLRNLIRQNIKDQFREKGIAGTGLSGGYMHGGYGTNAGASHNEWLDFRRAHKGYSLQEQAKMYKEAKKKKKPAKRKAKKPMRSKGARHCIDFYKDHKPKRCKAYAKGPRPEELGLGMYDYEGGRHMRKPMKKHRGGAMHNPWLKFLAHFRRQYPHMKQSDLVKMASHEYRRM